MKTIIALVAASVLVAAIFTALPNPVKADKPTGWCFRFSGGIDCLSSHHDCNKRSDSVGGSKCFKQPESG